MALDQNSTKKRPRDHNSSDKPSVDSEKEPKLNLELLLSSPAFLTLFITHHFPNMSMEECACLLVKTKGIVNC